jgi:hypothetical protein
LKNPFVRIRLFQILIPQLHFGDFFNTIDPERPKEPPGRLMTQAGGWAGKAFSPAGLGSNAQKSDGDHRRRGAALYTKELEINLRERRGIRHDMGFGQDGHAALHDARDACCVVVDVRSGLRRGRQPLAPRNGPFSRVCSRA